MKVLSPGPSAGIAQRAAAGGWRAGQGRGCGAQGTAHLDDGSRARRQEWCGRGQTRFVKRQRVPRPGSGATYPFQSPYLGQSRSYPTLKGALKPYPTLNKAPVPGSEAPPPRPKRVPSFAAAPRRHGRHGSSARCAARGRPGPRILDAPAQPPEPPGRGHPCRAAAAAARPPGFTQPGAGLGLTAPSC